MIKDLSTEELKAELLRRENEEKASAKPKAISDPPFTNLRKMCQDYIDGLANDGYVDDDLDHYIFETAMTTLYGDDVWKWINGKH